MNTDYSATKSRRGRALRLLVAVSAAWALGSTAAFAAQALLVPSDPSGPADSVLSYQTSPPAFLGAFVSSATLGVVSPKSIAIGPDGNVYVVGIDANNVNAGHVNRFNGQTGAFINTFANSGGGIFGSAFGPNGKLYVTSSTSDRVFVFDSNGTQSTFVDTGSGGLTGARGLVFGPDGNLYVASAGSNQVLRYNGTTGAFIGIFASDVNARGLAFGPDGNLYVADFVLNTIQKFNGTTGVLINSSFASGGGLVGPVGVLFGADGNLYVSGFTSNNILRYNGSTGAFIDEIGSGNGLTGPRLMAFAPAAARPARVSYTDIWYTGVESGQGYNLVQSENFIFVTFFIYGPTGAPTWYIATLNWDGVDSFAGTVSATTGTFFGVPWIPGDLIETEVGTASFKPDANNPYQGIFSYAVPGVGSATKAIERQTLTSIILAGSYVGSLSATNTGCVDPANNGTSDAHFNLVVNQQANGNATFEFALDGEMCTLAGTLVPHGSLYTISGAALNCTEGGLATTVTVHQIAATAQGLEGNLSFSEGGAGAGCMQNASFSAVVRRGQ